MNTLDRIFMEIKRNREKIEKFGVRKLGVFGSVVRGEDTDKSDLDFLVELERNTFRSYMGLKFFLEDLFGRSVDLVQHNAIKERLRDEILQEVRYVEGF